ncbi:MAG TPA: hypothetical protein VIM12_00740 [Noviherbaspirillum sp.]|jgi:hypothetical protein|uniref:hypothetical protein n=1 Tax=Noviherbaspirillum sp. TaxID=1926288 RepID=UPI002F945C97
MFSRPSSAASSRGSFDRYDPHPPSHTGEGSGHGSTGDPAGSRAGSPVRGYNGNPADRGARNRLQRRFAAGQEGQAQIFDEMEHAIDRLDAVVQLRAAIDLLRVRAERDTFQLPVWLHGLAGIGGHSNPVNTAQNVGQLASRLMTIEELQRLLDIVKGQADDPGPSTFSLQGSYSAAYRAGILGLCLHGLYNAGLSLQEYCAMPGAGKLFRLAKDAVIVGIELGILGKTEADARAMGPVPGTDAALVRSRDIDEVRERLEAELADLRDTAETTLLREDVPRVFYGLLTAFVGNLIGAVAAR